MSNIFLIVESIEDWNAYYPSEQVISFNDYTDANFCVEKRSLVINLCGSYRYLDKSYYCSLIAEARGQRVIPSLEMIGTLNHPETYATPLSNWSKKIDKLIHSDLIYDGLYSFDCFFGETTEKQLKQLARYIFSLYPVPMMKVIIGKSSDTWTLYELQPLSLNELSQEQEDLFAQALDQFTKKVWRKPRSPKSYRYDLAILHNPNEKLPPSNPKALNNFIKAGKKLGIDVDLITPLDFYRLSEYDALFIRETTSTTDHTYTFACRALKEDMVVIDDPQSILRCTNKVFLAKLLESNGVSIPKTEIIVDISETTIDLILNKIGLPAILKVPDGSFSVGIEKAKSKEELIEIATRLLAKSHMIIVQEYLYTEYDWRIGILAKEPLFACQYFMVKNHWQIYEHHPKGKVASGHFKCFTLDEVPKAVIKTAIKAANLIGTGFYGVDIKWVNNTAYVIEVNDNPNVDAGVEDVVSENELYTKILNEFVRRLEIKRLNHVTAC